MQPFSVKSIQRNKFLLGTHLLHLGWERRTVLPKSPAWCFKKDSFSHIRYFCMNSAIIFWHQDIKTKTHHVKLQWAYFILRPTKVLCTCVTLPLKVVPIVPKHNRTFSINNFQNCKLKVLGKSVGLCKTSKRKDQLYISLLVSVWRIICENFKPKGLILAEIWMKIYTKKIKRILVLEKRYSNALTPFFLLS